MAVMNEAQNYYPQLFGTTSNSYSVGQVTGTTDEENGLKIEIPHSEPPNSSINDTADISKNDEKHNFNLSNTEHEEQAKCRTSKIADCKLHLNSPSGCKSRSHSRGRSRKRSRSPSVSSCSSSRSRSRSCTRSRSSSRSASRSRHYRRRHRRSSRSSSRSRSRSLGPRYRSHPSSSYRRYHRSPRSYHRSPKSYRSRSRSRSHVRVYNGRYRSQSRSRSRSHGRRYYGFARRAYPASFRSWRRRSISRSRGRSPLRLTEKDRRELLEIAKANAAKALGKSVDLPPSLKKDSWLTDTLHRSFEADSGKLSRMLRDC